MAEQRLADLFALKLNCIIERSAPADVFTILICSGVEEHFHNFEPAFASADVKCGLEVFVDIEGIVSALGEHELDEINVVFFDPFEEHI